MATYTRIELANVFGISPEAIAKWQLRGLGPVTAYGKPARYEAGAIIDYILDRYSPDDAKRMLKALIEYAWRDFDGYCVPCRRPIRRQLPAPQG